MAEILKKSAFKPGMTLEEYKSSKIQCIKDKLRELVSVGFSYDSKQFPADLASNFNYDILKNNPSSFVWPKNIATVTGASYALAEANINAFWTEAKNFIDPLLDANRDLIDAVAISTTIAEVDAVVDIR